MPRLPLFFYFCTLSSGATLGVSSWVFADDYFDPSFLSISGEHDAVDLSVFEKEGSIAEGNYTVSVFVNNQDMGQFDLTFERNSQDRISPLLTPKLLKAWGVNVANLPELKSLSQDTPLNNVSAYIPYATSTLDLARLRLDISVPQVAMDPEYIRGDNPTLWDNGIPALLLNYNISAGRNRNSPSNGSTTQSDNIFASVRGGINLASWRLRSTATYTRTKNNGTDNNANRVEQQTRFSDTYLFRDIRRLRSTLLMGEASTGGEVFDSVQFKGITLQSDEQMLPSQLRGYAPSISGIANTNARVTIRQNGNVIYETYVAPGPFYINDIQQAGLSGDYDVLVTESNGTERRFTVPYTALPSMLRPGGWKYELTAGRYNGALTQGSRHSNFILGTLMYGLKNGITGFGGALLAPDYQAVNGGAGVSLGTFGAISADMTHSIARLSVNADETRQRTGQSYRLRYSKSLMATGTSVDLTALRYSTEHFYNFSEFNSQGYSLDSGLNPWTLQRCYWQCKNDPILAIEF